MEENIKFDSISIRNIPIISNKFKYVLSFLGDRIKEVPNRAMSIFDGSLVDLNRMCKIVWYEDNTKIDRLIFSSYENYTYDEFFEELKPKGETHG